MNMKIFIDTADLDEIKEAQKWGIIDGVTTNPSLIKKAVERLKNKKIEISMEAYIKEICRSVNGPVSLEVKGIKKDELIREAELLYDIFNPVNKNVVIKIPINTLMSRDDKPFEGLKAIKELSNKGIPINTTLVMMPTQALLAAKVGAAYVSPFLGRIDDYIRGRLKIPFGKTDYFDCFITKKIEQEKRKVDGENVASLYGKMIDIDYSDNGIYDGVELVGRVNIAYFRAVGAGLEIIAVK